MPANNSENRKDNLANKNSADQDSSRYQANKANNKKDNRQGNNSQNTQGSNTAKDKIKEAGKKSSEKRIRSCW